MRLLRHCVLLLSAAAIAPAVLAHTPYLAPTHFEPVRGGYVSFDAAFAEEFFVPEVVFDNSAPAVLGPDGERRPFDQVLSLKTRLVLEHQLPAEGTYRFSTGPRLGAVFRTWELDGERQSSREPDVVVPEGARNLAHFQSLTLAEAYVSHTRPDRAALKPYGQGLELVAISHPTDLYVGERFELVVQFEGRPLPEQTVEFSEAVWTSDRSPRTLSLRSDANGRVSLPLEQAGAWLALTRHRAPAPAGAPAPEYSHSYTLSFRVLEK